VTKPTCASFFRASENCRGTIIDYRATPVYFSYEARANRSDMFDARHFIDVSRYNAFLARRTLQEATDFASMPLSCLLQL
jgi:hypothetical protein